MPLLLGALGIIAGLFLFEILKRLALFAVMCVTAPPQSQLPGYDPVKAKQIRHRLLIAATIWIGLGLLITILGAI